MPQSDGCARKNITSVDSKSMLDETSTLRESIDNQTAVAGTDKREMTLLCNRELSIV